MRTKHTFRLPPDLAGQLADYAGRKRVPQRLSSKPRSRRTYRLIIPNGWKRLLAVGSIV